MCVCGYARYKKRVWEVGEQNRLLARGKVFWSGEGDPRDSCQRRRKKKEERNRREDEKKKDGRKGRKKRREGKKNKNKQMINIYIDIRIHTLSLLHMTIHQHASSTTTKKHVVAIIRHSNTTAQQWPTPVYPGPLPANGQQRRGARRGRSRSSNVSLCLLSPVSCSAAPFSQAGCSRGAETRRRKSKRVGAAATATTRRGDRPDASRRAPTPAQAQAQAQYLRKDTTALLNSASLSRYMLWPAFAIVQ